MSDFQFDWILFPAVLLYFTTAITEIVSSVPVGLLHVSIFLYINNKLVILLTDWNRMWHYYLLVHNIPMAVCVFPAVLLEFILDCLCCLYYILSVYVYTISCMCNFHVCWLWKNAYHGVESALLLIEEGTTFYL